MNKNKADRSRTGQTKTYNNPCRRGRGQTLPPINPSFLPVVELVGSKYFILFRALHTSSLGFNTQYPPPPKRGYVAACISCASCTFQYVCCQMLWSMSEKLQKKEKNTFFQKRPVWKKGEQIDQVYSLRLKAAEAVLKYIWDGSI